MIVQDLIKTPIHLHVNQFHTKWHPPCRNDLLTAMSGALQIISMISKSELFKFWPRTGSTFSLMVQANTHENSEVFAARVRRLFQRENENCIVAALPKIWFWQSDLRHVLNFKLQEGTAQIIGRRLQKLRPLESIVAVDTNCQNAC